LGEPAHVSGLVIRGAKVTGTDKQFFDWLLKVAVKRGAAHYEREFDPSLPPDNPNISDEEVGIGLCSGEQPYLAAPAEITLFGRAALSLGYAGSGSAFAATHDVDAILPLPWLEAANENLDFWQAQQATNAELEPEGLYVTHLFRELEPQSPVG
jgi:hypothetical protein